MASMQGYGFQNDTRFAEIQARASARRSGNFRVTRALTEKGISKELASAQLEGLEPEPDRALRMVEKFEGKTLDEALKGKVWRFLASRGFSSGSIKVALAHLKQHAAGLGDEPD